MTHFVTCAELWDHGRLTYTAEGPNGCGYAEGVLADFDRVRAEAKRAAGLAA